MPTMKDPELNIEPPLTKEEQRDLSEAIHKIFLFSIGAFAFAIEEIEQLIGRTIERGEVAEQDSRKLLREVMEKRKGKAQDAENEAVKHIESVKSRVTLASKADIDTLNVKIAALSAQIDDLSKPEPGL